jgi:hypothetical protein
MTWGDKVDRSSSTVAHERRKQHTAPDTRLIDDHYYIKFATIRNACNLSCEFCFHSREIYTLPNPLPYTIIKPPLFYPDARAIYPSQSDPIPPQKKSNHAKRIERGHSPSNPDIKERAKGLVIRPSIVMHRRTPRLLPITKKIQ